MNTTKRQARERAREAAAARARAQAAAAARRRRLVTAAIAVAAVLVVAAVLIVVKLAVPTGGRKSAQPELTGAAAAAVVDTVSKVSPATLNTIGTGKVNQIPGSLTGQPALTADGKPLVVYIGAEYCPYCAAERWAMVLALSRFGTFSNLGISHSATGDVFPDTATFTFHGSTYASDHLSFQGVETQTNEPRGNGYAPLDKLTPQQQQLLDRYDAPPYVPSQSSGAIPFVDLGNRYLISGASFDPQVLAGKSATEIAAALNDPSSPIAQSIGGAANAITTALCRLTNGQPANVCTSPAATAYAGRLS